MELKLVLVILTITLGLLLRDVDADFYFNRPYPKPEDHPGLNLKCSPGRTVIKIEQNNRLAIDDSGSEEYRRSPRRFDSPGAAEHCFMCVCSVDGHHEYCNKRPVDSLNECLVLASVMKKYERGETFDHEKSLAFRIRRDLIWHNDEIPYDPQARCYRGHSYYTNHNKPNETDINYGSDVTSLLDYKWRRSCYFCVCSVSGDAADCIPRHQWFCNYYRQIRPEHAARDMYAQMFQQDRPTYFRQLSWNIRRTMDDSMFDFIDQGGDTLCCSHSDGHRRQIHNGVRNKLRTLKRRVPKENLLGGPMGADYVDFIVNND